MDTPWRHRHHGGCRSAISLPAIVLVGAMVITACSDRDDSSTTPPPVISLTAAPSSVGVNDSSTLTWLVWDGASCEASGAWSGSKPLSGSEIVGPLTTSNTFILTCQGAADDVQSSVIKGNLAGTLTLKGDPAPIDVSASEAVTVAVVGLPPPPAPTVSLTANPTTVDMNGSSTLSWSSTDASACSAGGAWSGTKATSGSEAVGALTTTSTFTLVCNGAGGSAEQSVMVGVNAPPPLPAPTVSLAANPAMIAYGAVSTLTWSSRDATSCAASGDWSGMKATSGDQSVGPLTQTSTFILTCSGPAGSAGRSVTVAVDRAPLPTVSLTANPTTVDMNGSSTLSWSSTDASACSAGGAWSGSKPLSGNASVGPLTETSIFTLTCSGPGGSTNRPLTVSVLTEPEPISGNAADVNGYTAKYECTDGTTLCTVDLDTIVARACDDTVTTADSLSAIESSLDTTTDGNSDGSIVICADAGDYTDKGRITLTASGTSSIRRVFRMSGSSTTHPIDLTVANRATLGAISVSGDFWIFHRLHVDGEDGITSGNGFSLATTSEDIIINKMVIERASGRLVESRGDRITVQNSVIRDNEWAAGSDRHCTTGNSSTDLNMVRNEIYNCAGDGFQQSTGNNTGTVLENNDIYADSDNYCDADGTPNSNGLFMAMENGIDIKNNSGGTSNPMLIIHNRFFGFKDNDSSCASDGSAGEAAIIHGGPADYVLFQNNIIDLAPFGVSQPNSGPNNLSYIGNIFNNVTSTEISGEQVLSVEKCVSCEYYLNTIVNSPNADWADFSGSFTGGDIRCNVIIATADKVDTPGSGTEADYNTYYGVTAFTTESPGTNKDAGSITTKTGYTGCTTLGCTATEDTTGLSVDDIVRTVATPPADGTVGDFLFKVVTVGVSGSIKAVRGPFEQRRKLLTVSGGELFYIPYAAIDSSALEFEFCPGLGDTDSLGSRTSIGVNDDQGGW